jgi:hypothetical protein
MKAGVTDLVLCGSLRSQSVEKFSIMVLIVFLQASATRTESDAFGEIQVGDRQILSSVTRSNAAVF